MALPGSAGVRRTGTAFRSVRMKRIPRPIHTVEAFYAHALAIEREASERYGELEAFFRKRGDDALAGLCGSLARMEAGHFNELAKSSRHLRLPALAPGEHEWMEDASPESVECGLASAAATPRGLLELALRAECSALAFFEWAARSTPDAHVRALAREMAAEEVQHVRWVKNALESRIASA